jgi:hypothetical protein
MKKPLLAAGTISILACSLLWADTLTVSFASLQIPGTYSPNRDVVVYVVNNTGAFVRTVAVWGGDRNDCGTWNTTSSGSTVDAKTGATVRGTTSSNLVAGWNMKNASGQVVANGTYWLVIEGTATDNDANDPREKIKLVLDGTSKTLAAVDSSLNNGSTYFTAVNVVINAASSTIVMLHGPHMCKFTIGRMSFTFPADITVPILLSLYKLNGIKAAETRVENGNGTTAIDFNNMAPGLYLAKIDSRKASLTRQVFISR